MDVRQLSTLSPAKLALMVQRLRAGAGGAGVLNAEPVAVVGVGCRFPGAESPEAFWRLLHDGVEAVGDVPPERWDAGAFYDPDPDAPGKAYTRRGAFLGDVSGFDAPFFNVSPREARTMDPQQRLLLEVAWEALEDAGIPAPALEESRTGVYLGVCTNDYGRLLDDRASIDPYFGTGNNASVAAGRIAYVLGLRGPAVAVDTACSASLAALHLACQALRAGECDAALAGGVNLILLPDGMIYFSRLKAMSPGGRCSTFDAAADGYVRGEGCGIVVLKRLSDVLADGDRVHALVRGSAMNQDGRSNGLTAPSGPAQEAVVRAALQAGCVAPAQVGVVEAHGTGTPLGDPIEVRALAAVLSEGRAPGRPFALGSVKTNLGHLEAAAGIAGVIKTVLALRHREVPPHLHFRTPSPHVDWARVPAFVPTAPVPWEPVDGRRIAGVSSFGFSGTNVHVVLEEAPPADPAPADALLDGAAHLLPISARSPGALRALAAAYRERLAEDADGLAAVCRTAGARRTHHEHRLAVAGRTAAEMRELLDAWLDGRDAPGLAHGRQVPGAPPRVAFVFPGQGSQWAGMGRGLLAAEPVFRQAMEACAAALSRWVEWDLLDVLANAEDLDALGVDVVQPTLFSVQVALAALWRSWGVHPAAVAGHSMGEAAAAYVAGALSLDDAARVVCLRSALVRRAAGTGAMAAAALPRDRAGEMAAAFGGRLAVAASNGPRTVLVSGDPAAVDGFVDAVQADGGFARRVKVDYASHSAHMDPLLGELRSILADVAPRAADLPFHSTVDARVADGASLDADYWARNIREPVQLWETVRGLSAGGIDVFLEISPHPVLLPALQEGIAELGADAAALPSLRRGEDERGALLASLGALYARGAEVVWDRLAPSCPPVDLPRYPWQRERYWITDGISPSPATRPSAAGAHPLLGARTELAHPAGAVVWQAEVTADAAGLGDHRVQGAAAVPGAAYLEMALSAASASGFAAEARDVDLRRLLFLPDGASVPLQTTVERREDGTGEMRIFSGGPGAWTLHAVARLGSPSADAHPPIDPPHTNGTHPSTDAAGSHGTHPPTDIARSNGAHPSTDILSRIEIARSIDARPSTDAFSSADPASVDGDGSGWEEIQAADYYAAAAETGVELGPAFRRLASIRRGEGEAVADLAAGDPGAAAGCAFHPALLDACLQLLAVAAAPGEDGGPSVPVSVARVTARAPASAARRVRARRDAALAADGGWGGDAWLLDEAGGVVAELAGVRFRPLDAAPQRSDAALERWLMRVAWEDRPLPSLSTRPADGAWVLCAGSDGPVGAVEAALERIGEACVRADGVDAQALERALAAAGGADRCRGVVHLGGLDRLHPEDGEALLDAAARGAGEIAALVRGVAEGAAVPRLWIATRGAVGVEAGDVERAPAAAPLWGIGRTAALEHPALRCTLVDVDGDADALARELAAGADDDQVAWRAGRRRVARLAPATFAESGARPPSAPAPLRADATCLVTGGLGALGMEVAAWMAENGARSLALLGRGAPSPAAAARIEALRAAGASVRVFAADAARYGELAAVLEAIDREMPPLAGVVHAAGEMRDATLLRADPADVRAVLAPKVAGGWNLHALTAGRALDFFVLFSSTAGTLGAPGQAAYAGANAFLDALAALRRAGGDAAASIAWAGWSGVGLAAARADRGARLEARGVASIAPREGVRLFGALRAAGAAQLIILPLDLALWRRAHPEAARQPLFAGLLAADASSPEGTAEGTGDAGDSVRDALLALPAGPARRARLEDEVLRQIAAVVGLRAGRMDPRDPLSALGIDSLMALEVRNRLEGRLGVRLPATLLWRFPSAGALAAHLAGEMGVPLDASPAAPPAASADPAPRAEGDDELDGLSSDELAALLARELAAAPTPGI